MQKQGRCRCEAAIGQRWGQWDRWTTAIAHPRRKVSCRKKFHGHSERAQEKEKNYGGCTWPQGHGFDMASLPCAMAPLVSGRKQHFSVTTGRCNEQALYPSSSLCCFCMSNRSKTWKWIVTRQRLLCAANCWQCAYPSHWEAWHPRFIRYCSFCSRTAQQREMMCASASSAAGYVFTTLDRP